MLVAPAGAEELATIDPFGDDSGPAIPLHRGPSLFERIAMAARGAAWDRSPEEAEADPWTVQRIARRA